MNIFFHLLIPRNLDDKTVNYEGYILQFYHLGFMCRRTWKKRFLDIFVLYI